MSNQWSLVSLENFIQFAMDADLDIKRITEKGEPIEVIQTKTVKLNENTTYKINRLNTKQIQVYHGEEQVTAKPVLREIIAALNFDVELEGLNTQQMGKKVMDLLPD